MHSKPLNYFIVLCSYFFLIIFTLKAQPVITSFTPSQAKPGDALTIIGSGFNATTTNNIVYFGATKATVTAAAATQLDVTVPQGATFTSISVLNTETLLTGFSFANFNPIFAPSKTGIGSGDLNARENFLTGWGPNSVAVADLDGDGKPDMAVTNIFNNVVSVFRNSSTSGSINSSSFQARVDFATGSQPQKVMIKDLDGDGKPELCVLNTASNTISVLKNTAVSGSINSSSFSSKVDFATGNSPRSLAISDIDGDGKPELIAASFSSNAVSVFRNTSTSSSISFATRVNFTMASAISVDAGDFDGDNKPDLVAVGASTVSVFRNISTTGTISSSSFSSKVDLSNANHFGVVIADFDGDSKLDIITSNYTSSSVSIFRNISVSGSITVSSFAPKVDFGTVSAPSTLAIGDLDGDTKPDIAVLRDNDNYISILRNMCVIGSSITNASFGSRIDFETEAQPRSIAINDLDLDGKPDLAIANTSSAVVSVFRNADISTTTWDGSNWTNGNPSSTIDAIIANSNPPSNFTAKGIIINSGVELTTTNITATIHGDIINNGNGIVSTGNLVIASSTGMLGNPINLSGTLTVNSGAVLETNDKLTFSSNATSTGCLGNSAGLINGIVTVERYIPAGSRAFRMLTPSVTTTNFIRNNWQEGVNNTSLDYANNQNPIVGYGTHITGSTNGSNGFDATSTGASSMFTFNNLTQNWSAIANTNATNLLAGNAYRVLIRGNRSNDLNFQLNASSATTLRAKGSLLTGTVVFSSSGSSPNTLPTLSPNASEFSLVANPYVSSIDWTGLSKTGLTDFYYIWDPTIGSRGAYVSCNIAGIKSNPSSNVTTAIQSGQAFFVQNNSSIASRALQIEETHKTDGITNVFRTQEANASLCIQLYLTQKIATNISQDGAVILFNSNYSNLVNDEDASKLVNQDENIAIQRGNSLMSIESRNMPSTQADTVYLKLWQLKDNNYSFKIEVNNFTNPLLQAFLKDNYLNTETPINLSGTTIVNFTTNAHTATTTANRFSIVFKTSNVLPVSFSNLKGYPKNNTGIQVEWQVQNEQNLDVYTVEKSLDGSVFSSIGTVEAKSIINYHLFDANGTNDNNFYRIKAIDKNGKYKYSSTLQVRLRNIRSEIKIVANPIKNNKVEVQFNNVEQAQYFIKIYNSLGQLMVQKNLQHLGGNSVKFIECTPLAKGMYHVHIRDEKSKLNITEQIMIN